MQYLLIKIEEHTDGMAVSVDNLSREDATDLEKELADSMEQLYRVVVDKMAIATKATAIPGTRY